MLCFEPWDRGGILLFAELCNTRDLASHNNESNNNGRVMPDTASSVSR